MWNVNPTKSSAELATDQTIHKFISNDKRKPFRFGNFLEHGGHAQSEDAIFLQMAIFLAQRRPGEDGSDPVLPAD